MMIYSNGSFIFKSLLLVLVMLSVSTCSEETREYLYSSAQPSKYFSSSRAIDVEIYYETNAEPYMGNLNQTDSWWDITEDNLTEIFSFRTEPPDISVPKNLDDENVYALGDFDKEVWTADDILQLHKDHHHLTPSETQAVFYIYFLDGHLSTDGQVQNGVIGVSLGGTPILAIFKPVIKNSTVNIPGGIAGMTEKYVEQSTIVHELGHAIGLVNNGIPMTVNHQDEAHGNHTSNEDCVMYYANEGFNGLRKILPQLMAGDFTLWGPEVLADVEGYSQ